MTRQYTSGDARSGASKFGQMIGEGFERVVIALITDYIARAHPEHEILQPEQGSRMVTLEMLGGAARQMDTVVAPKDSIDPVALLETKWLKDARHHNDKGAWILQLREVRKQYPTIRGAVAILAGYWTEGVGVLLMSEGGIKMVVVATDEEIYSTLQGPLDEYLGEDSFVLDAPTMRQSYPRPWDLANFLIELEEAGRLEELAASWLGFVRGEAADGSPLSGAELVKVAIDELLEPLPEEPRITSFEVALQVDSGNTIYQEFEDVEDVVEFIRTHFQNPQTILERITPKKSPRQQRFADFE